MNVDVLILTPIKIEYQALVNNLPVSPTIINVYNKTFTKAIIPHRLGSITILIRKTGSGISTVTLETQQAIANFNPHKIFLIGTAGGIKKLTHGDILLADRAYSYENGRERNGVFSARPISYPCSSALLEEAIAFSRTITGNKALAELEGINILQGSIISGNKVIESLDNQSIKIIRQYYDDAIALEMEAFGFYQVMKDSPHIDALSIRSISDLLTDKRSANKNDSREIASKNAALFTLELIQQLTFPERGLKKKFKQFLLTVSSILLIFLFYLSISWYNKKPSKNFPSISKIDNNTDSSNVLDHLKDSFNINQQSYSQGPALVPTNQNNQSSSESLEDTKIRTRQEVLPGKTSSNEVKEISLLDQSEVITNTEKDNAEEINVNSNETLEVDSTTITITILDQIPPKQNKPESVKETEATKLSSVPYRLFVYDPQTNERLRDVEYYIDGQPMGVDEFNLDLTPGIHSAIFIHDGKEKKTKIKVPDYPNKIKKIYFN